MPAILDGLEDVAVVGKDADSEEMKQNGATARAILTAVEKEVDQVPA